MSTMTGFHLATRRWRENWRARDAARAAEARDGASEDAASPRRDPVLWCDDVAHEAFFFPGPDVLVRTWHQPRQ